MSYRLSANVIGAEELARVLRSDIAVRELTGAIRATAARAEFTAKAKAPIQYGHLRGSINTDGPHVTANNIEATVGTKQEYARYQEEGTGIYGPRKEVIRPKSAKMLVWKQGGQTFFARSVKGVRPKRYFKQARDEAKPYLVEQMRGALARIVTHLATR